MSISHFLLQAMVKSDLSALEAQQLSETMFEMEMQADRDAALAVTKPYLTY